MKWSFFFFFLMERQESCKLNGWRLFWGCPRTVTLVDSAKLGRRWESSCYNTGSWDNSIQNMEKRHCLKMDCFTQSWNRTAAASLFVILSLFHSFVLNCVKNGWMTAVQLGVFFSWFHGGPSVSDGMREDWTLMSSKQQVLCLHTC